MRPLLLRCAANLLKTVPEGGMRNAAAVREDILSSFQTLFTEEAAEDALDYFECKFGSAFKSLRLRTSPAFTIHDAPKEHGRPPSSSSREETAETENTRSYQGGVWLPFLDTYRTMCLAPQPDFRRVLAGVLAMELAA